MVQMVELPDHILELILQPLTRPLQAEGETDCDTFDRLAVWNTLASVDSRYGMQRAFLTGCFQVLQRTNSALRQKRSSLLAASCPLLQLGCDCCSPAAAAGFERHTSFLCRWRRVMKRIPVRLVLVYGIVHTRSKYDDLLHALGDRVPDDTRVVGRLHQVVNNRSALQLLAE
jgi:hypothetical protein